MNTNRKLTMLFIAFLLFTAASASAGVYTSNPQKIRDVPDHHQELDVEIWTDRGDGARYRAGDSIEVFFRTNVDAWVAIYDRDTRGRVTRLFPSRHARSNFVRGGVINRLPSRYGHHFEVEGPSGWETLRAVASTNRHALLKYRWNDDRWADRDRQYNDRHYDDRDYDRRYRATSSKVSSVPDKIRDVPDYRPPHDPPHSPALVVDQTRHYVREGYYRPNRPWWQRR